MSALVPFDQFLAAIIVAKPEDFADALGFGAAFAGVTPEIAHSEFDRMKAYLLSHYEGVHPVGSYLDEMGQTVDCVPFEQQPTVRAAVKRGILVARTGPSPPQLSDQPDDPPNGPHPKSITPPKRHCPEGTVPLVRITLDRLVRLGTLDNFFRKIPRHVPPTLHPPDGG
jgi:hypothetical protein